MIHPKAFYANNVYTEQKMINNDAIITPQTKEFRFFPVEIQTMTAFNCRNVLVFGEKKNNNQK